MRCGLLVDQPRMHSRWRRGDLRRVLYIALPTQRSSPHRPVAKLLYGTNLRCILTSIDVVNIFECEQAPNAGSGVVASGVRRMNEVNPRRARLVLGWVTVFGRVYHLGM